MPAAGLIPLVSRNKRQVSSGKCRCEGAEASAPRAADGARPPSGLIIAEARKIVNPGGVERLRVRPELGLCLRPVRRMGPSDIDKSERSSFGEFSSLCLADAQQIPLTVSKPCGSFADAATTGVVARHFSDTVDGLPVEKKIFKKRSWIAFLRSL